MTDAAPLSPPAGAHGVAAVASVPLTPAFREPPDTAAVMFGQQLDLARRYADLLCTAGVQRGLIGPREPSRIWTRHLLNCAAVTDVIPEGVRVVDVGSGAGLPGVAMALRRPDLQVDLLEPLERRCRFLLEVVDLLGLARRVRVVRMRAESGQAVSTVGGAAVVTARAVAPLGRLLGWCTPLLGAGGMLALIRGEAVRSEMSEQASTFRRLRLGEAHVALCGDGMLDAPVPVVVATRSDAGPTPVRRARSRTGRQQGRRARGA